MNRRAFLGQLGAIVAAPAIVRASSLMPWRVISTPAELVELPAVIEPGLIVPGGLTNFAELTGAQKLVWSREVWRQCRLQAYMSRYVIQGAA